jgi:hypothetical protein
VNMFMDGSELITTEMVEKSLPDFDRPYPLWRHTYSWRPRRMYELHWNLRRTHRTMDYGRWCELESFACIPRYSSNWIQHLHIGWYGRNGLLLFRRY